MKKPVNWCALQINWLVSIWYDVLLKGNSDYTTILTVIIVLFNSGVLKYEKMIDEVK